MQVYVDESGDSGMKDKPGSSQYFVVAAVTFREDTAAARCRAGIRALREKMRWSPRQEFKFNRSDDSIRHAFFETVRQHDFEYNAVVLNKRLLTGPGFQFKESFYKYTVRLVFSNARSRLDNATVVIDQSGSRDFRNQMQKYLQAQISDRVGNSPIKRVRTEKSHACELVQMADMVVGAVARSFLANRTDCARYRDMIRRHELDVQLWPK